MPGRSLHPVAWWTWAIGIAAAAGLTTNPLLLALMAAVVTLVVVARRGSSPWARAFRLYVVLGLVVVAFRVFFYVLVGLKYGELVVLRLPAVPMPSWAAGIQLLGPISVEGLVGAATTGMRLAVLIVAIGGANALANPKRLLRAAPRALHEVGTAVVVAISVAPQLAESVRRVMRARELRGDSRRGLRAVGQVVLPVLQDTLDRSLMLASAMESRGYGHRGEVRRHRLVPVLTLGGLCLASAGVYGVLSPLGTPGWMGFPLLALGVGASVAGLALAGRSMSATRYRPDPWRWPETVTALCGLSCLAGLLVTRSLWRDSLVQATLPLAAPALPWAGLVGIVLAALPAVLAPAPEATTRPERRVGAVLAEGTR